MDYSNVRFILDGEQVDEKEWLAEMEHLDNVKEREIWDD